MRKITLTITIIMVFAITASCSKNSNPIEPGHKPENSQLPLIEEVIQSESNSIPTNRGVFGAWQVLVDIEKLTAEIIPSRNASAIGDIFDADLSQFLTVSPCSNCMTISQISFDSFDDLNIELTMRHPFSNLTSRPDLHGFDVRAIIIMENEYPETYPDIHITQPGNIEENALVGNYYNCVLNQDGLTSHYDSLVTDERYFINGADIPGNLNPYFRFFEDYSTDAFDPHAPSGHNVMPVGSGNESRTIVFDYDEIVNSITFFVVADVAYGHSATFLNRDNPQYYLPWYNRTEAWRVEYWIENNNLSMSDPASTADIVVQVFDWQHGFTVDANYPDPANPNGIPETSDVLQVEFSIPQYQYDSIIVTTPESGDGSPTNPLQYRLTVTNENSGSMGAIGLLSVRDTLYGQAAPNGRFPIPENPAGFPYATEDILDYALYQQVSVNIVEGMIVTWNTYPFGDNALFINTHSMFAPEQFGGTSDTSIKGTYHRDWGHEKFQYAWDYNYDGVTFDQQGTGMPSPEIQYASGGLHNVGLRVRDNAVPPHDEIFTLPVWAEGEAFQDRIGDPGVNEFTSSDQRGHSVAITEERIYIAYTRDIADETNVYVAVGDRDNNFISYQVTDNPQTSISPVLTVVEEGVDEGLYVAYSEFDGVGNAYIHASYGNIDGTGFAPANINRISDFGVAMELSPSMLYFNDQLFVYYTNFPIVSGRISGSYSIDGGLTWFTGGALIVNGSTIQINPTAATDGGDVYIVWEDYMDAPTNGSDLWLAKTSDGFTFDVGDIQKISALTGASAEMYPNMTQIRRSTFAIVYKAKEDTSTFHDIRLKVIDDLNPLYDIKIAGGSSSIRHTRPSVGSSYEKNLIVAYGEYNLDNDDLYSIVDTVEDYFNVSELYREYVGNVTNSNASLINPCAVCRAPYPVNLAEDCMVAWKSYTDGIYEKPSAQIFFGHIELRSFVIPSNADFD